MLNEFIDSGTLELRFQFAPRTAPSVQLGDNEFIAEIDGDGGDISLMIEHVWDEMPPQTGGRRWNPFARRTHD
jgi:hypothetical protein